MDENKNRTQLKIGELAGDLGLNPKTIRYYEEIGLLPEPERTLSGYRVYTHSDRERLRFIAKAKAIGLTLEEIGEILRLREGGEQPCKHVVELLDSKVAQVDHYLRALSDFRQELLGLREEAAENVTDEAHYCRIIERHEGAQHDEHLLSGFIQAPQRRGGSG